MIVYIESNFVLEMALEQEQVSAANAVFTLAESEKIGIKLDLEPMVNVLKEAHMRQIELLHETLDRLLSIGDSIEIDVTCFREALRYQQVLSLSPQDSIIYAAIVADLKKRSLEEKKYFLSKDRRAFDNDDDRDIKAELATYNCHYIGSFAQGLDAIKHVLKPTE